MTKRLAILTGGGDCPGLNAAIRAVTRRSLDRDWDVVGLENGWKGLIDGSTHELGRQQISGVLPRGGTILGTSRTNPYKLDGGADKVMASFSRLDLDALVAIGGEDTLGVAARLHEERGLPVVGVPKTIDNDLSATDYTIGFDTAVAICTEAIDRLHTTAESHNRVMVAEVMGRHTGWIAVHSGIAGGADVILIPEQPTPLDEVCSLLDRRHRGGRTSRSSSSPRATSSRGWPTRKSISSVTSGWAYAASATSWRTRSRSARASRRASRSSATFSAAGRPRRAIECSQLASGWKPQISSTTGGSAGWPRSRVTRSSTYRSPRPPPG